MAAHRSDPDRLSIQELANQAEVTPDYVVRLNELGALEPTQEGGGFTPSDVGRIRILHAWEESGLSVESIMELVRSQELSISWLDAPTMPRTPRLDMTFEQLSSEADAPVRLM